MALRSGPINIYTVILSCLILYLILRTISNVQNVIIKREEHNQIININTGQCPARDPYAAIPSFMYKLVQDIVKSDQLEMPNCGNGPKKNFVFLQVYGCASENLAAMFGQYVLKNDRTAVLPVLEKRYIGWPHYLHSHMYKKLQENMYNALIHRTVYNRSRIAALLPEDTVYITNIRDPAYRLGSALESGGMKSCGHMPQETDDVIQEFFTDMERYDNIYKAPSNILQIEKCRCIKKGISIAKNAMAFDLGFYTGFHMYTRDKSRNYTYIHQWLKDMHTQLDVIMIQERFNESLVFLKRYMCWGFRDIMYKTVTFVDRKEYISKYKEEYIHKFRQWSNVDTLLYDMASQLLTKRVESLGSDFQSEVAEFKRQLSAVNTFCTGDTGKSSEIKFMASKWDGEYVITQADCSSLSLAG